MNELKESKIFNIRFSEVDSMNVVWHGSYPLYFEDAREAFGKKYGLEYMSFFGHGYFAPLVELTFHYKKPIKYGMCPRIDIIYRPTEAAKIIFDYEIHDPRDESLIAMGHSKSGKTKCDALIKRNVIFSSKTKCNKIKTHTAQKRSI